MKNYKQKNSIQNVRIIEMLIMRKNTDYINNKLNMLPVHKELSQSDFNKTQIDFDATRLFPSAMCVKKSF